MAPDPVELALILARVLERLGIRYCVGGSVASSVYGEVRTTLDVDLVAELGQQPVDDLLAATQGDFHKADVYVSPDDALHRDQFARSRRIALRAGPGSEVQLASPEDVVIHKLRWYRMGGGVSDRGYLAQVAADLGLADLFARALSEAGSS